MSRWTAKDGGRSNKLRLLGLGISVVLLLSCLMISVTFGAADIRMAKQITALTLGEEVAKRIGLRVGWVKAIAAIVVVLLADSAVALAGPIGFVGLVIPHVARFWVGVDYRWILPYAAIWGALLLMITIWQRG